MADPIENAGKMPDHPRSGRIENEDEPAAAPIAGWLAELVAMAEKARTDPETQRRELERQRAAEARAAAELAERIERLPAARLAWLLDLGVPLEEAEVAAAGVERRPAVVLLDKLSERRPILVLAGNTGCGKSVAAATALLTWAGPREDGSQSSAAFITAVDFGRLWPRRPLDRERLTVLERATAVVVDDLGAEEEDVRSRLDHLVYQRAGNRRKTVITTNMNAREFRTRYEERVWSRIEQSGNFEGIDEPDYRVAARRNGKRQR